MRHQQGGHGRLVHADAYAVARNARLCDLEERAADLVTIADAHFVIGQALYREILAELSERKIAAAELSLPVAIGVHLIHHHRALLAAVSGQISLSVASDIQAPGDSPVLHRLFPNGSAYRPSPPRDVLWKTYVHRYQPRHEKGSFVTQYLSPEALPEGPPAERC